MVSKDLRRVAGKLSLLAGESIDISVMAGTH